MFGGPESTELRASESISQLKNNPSVLVFFLFEKKRDDYWVFL